MWPASPGSTRVRKKRVSAPVAFAYTPIFWLPYNRKPFVVEKSVPTPTRSENRLAPPATGVFVPSIFLAVWTWRKYVPCIGFVIEQICTHWRKNDANVRPGWYRRSSSTAGAGPSGGRRRSCRSAGRCSSRGTRPGTPPGTRSGCSWGPRSRCRARGASTPSRGSGCCCCRPSTTCRRCRRRSRSPTRTEWTVSPHPTYPGICAAVSVAAWLRLFTALASSQLSPTWTNAGSNTSTLRLPVAPAGTSMP